MPATSLPTRTRMPFAPTTVSGNGSGRSTRWRIPLVFAGSYWAATHDRRMFSAKFHQALGRIVATYDCEERHFACSTYHRPDVSPATRGGGASGTGLIWCAFRPSDDPTTRPFNIPQEMFATVALRELADLARVGYADRALASRALALSARVDAGIERYGRFYDFRFGWIYAYETDGRGDVRLMDDANIPNLLAASLYGYVEQSNPVSYTHLRAHETDSYLV